MTTLQTLIASYADAASARRAMVALRNAGVGDDAISVVGDVVVRPDSSVELVRKDRSMIMRIFWAALLWGMAGAVVGAGIGWLFAMLSFPTDNVAIQVASWAMFVHIAVTLWAAYAVIDDGTEQQPPRRATSTGESMVIVRTPDAALLSRAEAALTASGAIGVRRG